MAQRRVPEPLTTLFTRNSSANPTRRKRRVIAGGRQLSSSVTRSEGWDQQRERDIRDGLHHFLSSSSCRNWKQPRRYYASAATATRLAFEEDFVNYQPLPPRAAKSKGMGLGFPATEEFTMAEHDEILFELLNSPDSVEYCDIPSTSTPTTTSTSSKPVTKKHAPPPPIPKGPPPMSREALWDWRRWPGKERLNYMKVSTETEKSKATAKGKGKAKQPAQWNLKRRKVDLASSKDPLEMRFGAEFIEYKKHFLPAIDAEQLADEEILNERLSSWPLEKLKEEGFCITGLQAFWMEKPMFGKPVAAFQIAPGEALPMHNFENGTAVLLSIKDPLRETPRRGSVVSTTTTQIRVCFPEKFSLDEPFDLDSSTSLSSSDWSPSHRSNLGEGSSTGELRGWRLDIGRPDLVFERMRAAVHSLGVELDEVLEAESQSNHDSSNPSSSSSTLSANPNISLEYLEWKENILQGTVLRDVLLKGFEPGRAGTRKRHLDEAKRDGEGHEGESSSSSLSAAHEEELVNEETDPFGGIDFEPEEAPTTETPSVEGVVTKIDHGIFFEDQRIQSWVRRYSLPVPLVMDGDMPLPGLNPSQIRAMALMIGKRVSLVQGPPGTGKTQTILQTLKLLKSHFRIPHPIMVCTYTNVAVDNLVEGLASPSIGLRPLRVGFGPAIRPSVVQYSLHRQLELHPRQAEFAEWQKEEEEVGVKMAGLTEKIMEVNQKLEARGVRNAGSDVGKEGKGKGLEGRLANMKKAFAALDKRQKRLKGKIYALQQEMLRDIVGAADVICTTCITAATSALNVLDFPIVFLDEASMSTEPASLIPLVKGCRHLALIGDHKQLPPVILSKDAKERGLGVSLFERLIREGNTPSVMLDTQYRMHPGISLFPSTEFYLGGVRDGTVDAEGNVHPGLAPPKSVYLSAVGSPRSLREGLGLKLDYMLAVDGGLGDGSAERLGRLAQPRTLGKSAQEHSEVEARQTASVIFLDHEGNESLKDRSRVNHAEAHIIASVVVDLLLSNPELRGADIGIIAPYVAQMSLLSKIFGGKHAQYEKLLREALGDGRYLQLAQIEVKTVDGFEGREKEVILFSTVRNNVAGHIGFLGDRRRLNVGLTRAKRALFIVGSIRTLREGKMSGDAASGTVRIGQGAESWRRYARYLEERGLVVSV